MPFRKFSILPGFYPCLIYTIIYLLIIVVIPLSGLALNFSKITFSEFIDIICQERVISAYKLTFKTAIIAALFNSIFGFLVSFILVRYNFFGKKFIDSIIDLPFALPTAIAGISLTSVYAKGGWIGSYFDSIGVEIAFTSLGIVLALIFVTLPFVVRTIEPVLASLDKDVEAAAASLGASRFTILAKIILPTITPAILAGFTLAFARGLSEYGSVIFIAGNIPMVSEIIPSLIVNNLEQYDYKAATAIAFVMLIISFALLIAINILQKYSKRFYK